MTDTLSLLKLRRSVPPQFLTAPGPDDAQLREILTVAARVPDLNGEWITDGRLHESLTANLDGLRFVSDPATMVRDGQSLLILSADAGG